jgi:hypothetical protein
MVLEPWMVKTAVVLAVINCLNLLLLWIARRRERAVSPPVVTQIAPAPEMEHAHRDAA